MWKWRKGNKVKPYEHKAMPDEAFAYSCMGEEAEESGDFEGAQEGYMKALIVCEQKLGEQHQDTLRLRNDLARFYLDRNNIHYALSVTVDTLNILKKLTTNERITPVTGTTYYIGALAAAKAAKEKADLYDNALTWHQAALLIRNKVLGNDHPDSLAAIEAWSETYKLSGKTEPFEDYIVRVMNK